MINQIKHSLQLFDSVSLSELSDYKLLNRIDTKYICNISHIPQILNLAMKDFKVQVSNNEMMFGYESLYFDTPDMKTYFDHHQGKRIRYKVRFRKYLDTGDVFLEVKKKKNYIRTDKKRSEFEFSNKMNNEHLNFLNTHIEVPKSGLDPTIWTLFNRITLAGKNHLERITIDTGICFKNNSKEISLPNLAIIEVKRNKTGSISPFIQILKETRIRPYGISKYIMGNILINPNLKHNRFKRKVVTVNKICYGT